MVSVANAAIGGILKGVEIMANGFVDAINRLIQAWNSIPGNPLKVGTLGHVSLPYSPIPQVALANGGIVTKPTVAMIGENGPEAVIPLGKSHGSSSAGGITINQYINGSILAERDVQRIADQGMKLNLKRMGFTGY